ncbi:metal ABC transporter substrate-binding protein [Algirhabdus cladophorae]|uniref:metal ABC transporter substrate-binding protein n=1 Tax=Algirhabdus cladophorae TaxID=3377108 RepID=UPI003B84B05F
MTLLRSALAVLFSLLAASAALAQDRPTIVTVNYPLQYFAQRLVGDAADVVFPVPRDVDPSFWRPAIADISAIQSADLILLNGAGFATWIDRVSLPRSKVVNTTAKIENQFIRTESITHSHGEGQEHSHEGTASYTWLDPMLAIAQAEAVAAAITTRGIAPADKVEAQLDRLRTDLEALDKTAVASLGGLQNIAIIATHPRYQYFARRHGLSIASLEWDAGAMPTQAERADLVTLVDEKNAQILIWEAEPPAAAFAITRELGLHNVVFPPLAHPVEGQTFLQSVETTLTAISGARQQ